MAGPAEILRELHHLRQHAKDLSTEIDRGPAKVRTYQDKMTKQEQILKDAQDVIKKLKVAIHDKETSIKAKLQTIEKHEMQLNQASSKKEYDALKVEIASDKKDCRKYEDEILEAMTEVETRTAHLPNIEKELQKGKQEIHKLIDDVQSRRNGLSEELNNVHKKMREVEETLQPDVKMQYERLVNARGEDALSGVQGRTCIACYTEITTQNFNDLSYGKFVVCKSCGRMLYLAKVE